LGDADGLADVDGFGEGCTVAFGVGDGFWDAFGEGDSRGFGVGRGVTKGVGVGTASLGAVGETLGGACIGAGGVDSSGVGSGRDGSSGFSTSGGTVSFDSRFGGGASSGFPADAICPVSGLLSNDPGLTQTRCSSGLLGRDNDTNTSPPSSARWTNAVAAKVSLKRPSYS